MAQSDQLIAAIREAVEVGLESLGMLVEGQAIRRCPIDKGRLADSITWATATSKSRPRGRAKPTDGIDHDGTPLSVEIGTNVEYAAPVEYGSGIYGPTGQPFEIRPKDKKALFWKGAKHPVKVVHHPGSPAQPYLRPAADAAERNLPQVFGVAFQRVLSGKGISGVPTPQVSRS